MAIPTQDFPTAIQAWIEQAVREEVARQMHAIEQAKEETDTIKVADVARITGYKEGTIYEMVCNKKIPYFKVRRSLRFSRKEIIKWIEEEGKQNPERKRKHKPYNKSKD